jgi:NADH-quinone oxidoreductase subunit N
MQLPYIQLGPIAPELVLIAGGLVLLLIGTVAPKRHRYAIAYLALALTCVSFAVSYGHYGTGAWAFNDQVVTDSFAVFIHLILLLGTGIVILISIPYLARRGIDFSEYYCLVLFATSGMMFLASAADFIVVFLALEILSVSLYILVSLAAKAHGGSQASPSDRPMYAHDMPPLQTQRAKSEEAGMKYLILGGFGSAFLLFGIALIYGATGTTNLYRIGDLLRLDLPAMVAMGLIAVGFAFKVALIPFHMWTPDVYEGAPTPITAYMSIGTKAAAFAALIRILWLALPDFQPNWGAILYTLSMITVIGGNLIALAQTNIKRMLAYSSIAHAGYITIGIVAGTAEGLAGVLFYLVCYLFMNLGAFAVIAALERKAKAQMPDLDKPPHEMPPSFLEISHYSGLAKTNPSLSAAMAIFLVSLAGLPPLAGFFAKLYIFLAAVRAGLYTLAIVAVLASVVGVYYYLRVVWLMYMKPARPEELDGLRVFYPPDDYLSPQAAWSFPLFLALLITLAGTIAIGLFPGRLLLDAAGSIRALLGWG